MRLFGGAIPGQALREILLGSLFIFLFSLAVVHIPVFFFFAGLVWTVPVILLIRRYSLWAGVMALFLGALPLLFLFSWNQLGFIFTLFGPLALFFGLAFKNQVPSGRSILIGSILAFFSSIAAFYLLFQWDLGMVAEELRKETMVAVEAYKAMGYMETLEAKGISEKVLIDSMNIFITTIFRLLPAGLVLWSLTIALVNYLIAKRVFTRLNYKTPWVPGFSNWHLPWYSVWGLIIGLACLVIPVEGPWQTVFTVIGGNLLFIYFYILMVLGVAVCAYFYETMPFPSFLKGLVILLIILTLPQISFLIFAIIGLVDLLIDTRALHQSRARGES